MPKPKVAGLDQRAAMEEILVSSASPPRAHQGHRVRPHVLLLGMFLVLFPTATYATNGLKVTAFGARAAGRGGVDYAFADDGTGPATNPAGMGFVYGNRLDTDIAVIRPKARWDNEFGRQQNRHYWQVTVPSYSLGVVFDPSKDWEIAPIFDLGNWGLVPDEEEEGEADEENPPEPPPEELDLDEEEEELAEPSEEDLYGGPFRIGFGIFPVTGGRVQMKSMVTPNFATQNNWEVDALKAAITPSIAFRFNKYFSVGLALQFVYGQFELDGAVSQPSDRVLAPAFAFSAGVLLNANQTVNFADLDDAKGSNGAFGLSGRLGIMFNSDYVSVGVVYQERTRESDLLGRATVNATDEVNRLTNGNAAILQIVDPAINPAEGFVGEFDLRVQDFAFPRQVGVGIAVRPHRRFSFGIDYTFIHWSEVMRIFKTRLTDGNNNNLNTMTGGTIHVRIPLNWDNQHVIAIGATALVAEGKDIVEGVPSFQWVMRMGYNYGKNPSPGNTTLPQQPVIVEHHISIGTTLHIGPLMELNFAFEWGYPKKLSTGLHVGDPTTLSNARQRVEIYFFHIGLGVNF